MPEGEKENFLKEVLTFGAIALVVVLPIRLFVAQPFVVSGSSMEPTFENGEYLIIDELSYRFEEPERGDVVVFHYPKDPKKYFIKRIIGLPGETVHIRPSSVSITGTDGKEIALEEPYLVNEGNGENEDVSIGHDQYFVMGDNRPASSDSRMWGLLPRENIAGRAFLRLLPLMNADIMPGALNDFR